MAVHNGFSRTNGGIDRDELNTPHNPLTDHRSSDDPATGEGFCILLIDHDPAHAAQLSGSLSSLRTGPIQVEYVSSLAAALDSVAARRFDAILLDLSLPDGAGLPALVALRGREAEVPILVLGDVSDEVLALRALQNGAHDYLVRTRGDSDLIARLLRHVVERQRVEEALRRANAELQLWVTELEQRNRNVTMLVEMQELLQTCLGVEEAYTVFTRYAPGLFPITSGMLYVANPSRNLLVAAASWGPRPPAELLFAPDDCWALRRGRIHAIESAGAQLVCRHLEPADRPPPVGSLCVPLIAQGEALGLLYLCPAGGWDVAADLHHNHWSQARQQFAQTVAEQVALTLANLRLREVLRSQAIRDPLTGLFNRRYLEETLVRELHRSMRRKTQLGVILLDIDHFKAVNDQHGHATGDALLRELSAFLQNHTRGEDIACRYGGEEFILILPDSILESTRQRAEQIRDGVKNLMVQNGGERIGPITLSLGVASYPRHGTTVESLLAAADRALYRAKDAGRNRVVVAET